MRIGALAKSAGVNVETIRFYQREGLLATPVRGSSTYRDYPDTAVEQVHFIKKAQELGFSLKEAGELLAIRSSPSGNCRDVSALAKAKLADIDAKMKALASMKHMLEGAAQGCPGEGPVTNCSILRTIESAGRNGSRQNSR